MKKLCLLTGATGHLGSVLLSRLIGCGVSVRALVLPEEAAFLPPDVPYTVGNVTDPDSLIPFFEAAGYDEVTLIHCAAVVTITSRPYPGLWEINVGGTENVLRAARREGVSRMIYVSSVHAIPEQPAPAVIREPDAFFPERVRGQYAKTKAAASALVMEAARTGLNASIVLPSGIIGPGDLRRRNHSVATIRAMAAGSIPLSIRGGYDFVDVRDTAEGILQCEAHGRAGECYILSGEYASIRDLMRFACEAAGRRPPKGVLPAWTARLAAPAAEWMAALSGKKPLLTPYSIDVLQSNARFSHEKAGRALGYRPRSVADAVRDTVLL